MMNKNIFLSILLLKVPTAFSAARITPEGNQYVNSGTKRADINSDADDGGVTNKKIKTETSNNELNNAFLDAAKGNNIELVKELLSQGIDINFIREVKKFTFYKGCKIPTINHKEGPALGYAIYNRNVDLVKLLLDNKSDPNMDCSVPSGITVGSDIEYYTRSPIDLALGLKLFDIAGLLIDCGAKIDINQSFLTALALCDKRKVAFMLEKGANIESCFKSTTKTHSMSALAYALSDNLCNNYGIDKLLIAKGANINKIFDYGISYWIEETTSLLYLMCHNNFDKVKLLLEFGADLEVNTSKYGSALQLVSNPVDTNIYISPVIRKMVLGEKSRRDNEVKNRRSEIVESIVRYLPTDIAKLVSEFSIYEYEDIAAQLRANADS